VTGSPRRGWWLFWGLLAALALGSALYLDPAVRAWMAEHQTPGMRTFMRQVSWWGDWPAHAVVALAGAGIAYMRKNRRWVLIFTAMILACSVAGLANRVIKISTGRARPSVQADSGWKGPRLSSKYHAFPSGHTASSVAFFAALCLARRRIGLAFLPIPLVIAGSRLYLNAHHFSDVVGGAIVGIFWAILTWHFLSKRFPDPEVAQPPG